MKKNRKWVKALGIVGGILVLLVICGILGWRMLMTFFQNQYYQDAYAPLELAADGIGDYPAEHHLDDVPWFATEWAYCQSNSLQMIAAQKGIEEPRGYFDFLTGFPTFTGFSAFTGFSTLTGWSFLTLFFSSLSPPLLM